MTQSALRRVLAPVMTRLRLAALLEIGNSTAALIPFIAAGELARRIAAAHLLATPLIRAELLWLAGIAAGALLLRLMLNMSVGALTHFADIDLRHHLRRDMAAHMARLPLGWFQQRDPAEVQRCLQDDPAALHHLVGHGLTDLVSVTVTPLIVLGWLGWINPALTGVALLVVLCGMAFYALQFRDTGDDLRAFEDGMARLNAATQELVSGIAVLKSLGGATDRFCRTAEDVLRRFQQWIARMVWLSTLSTLLLSPLFMLFTLLAAGAVMTATLDITLPDMMPFLVLGPGLSAPFQRMAFARADLQRGQEAARKIIALMDHPTLPWPEPLEVTRPTDGSAEFRAVSFTYEGASAPALHLFDLTLPEGSLTAITGPSGSGKSTLAWLLARFHDPSQGSIQIGGADLRRLSPQDLARSVGVVFQTPQLLHMSLRDNIALARPEATQSEVEEAAQAVGLHEVIAVLPDGYETLWGAGAALSGGEAQRLTIARILLAPPRVLILDEPTSFADPQSQILVQQALSRVCEHSTVLMIAHRLHTMKAADQICVLDRGRIVQRGAHDTLMQDCGGLYARLWQAQQALEDAA